MNLIRARILLLDVEPEIWRLVELDPDLTLEQVHGVIQVVMGWQDYHLHSFREMQAVKPATQNGVGPPREWLTDLELAEGAPGLPERGTTLGEVLSETSALHYTYDYGDGWTHSIEFIEFIENVPDAVPATLVRGARSCPPEDAGGATGYTDLLAAFRNPDTPQENVFGLDPSELIGWANSQVGPWRDFDPEFLDEKAVNQELRFRFPAPAESPPPDTALSQLTAGIIDPLRMEFRAWLNSSRLDETLPISNDEAAEMVRPYAWLLDRIGEDGMKLTQAGYMPPQVVSDLMHELGWQDDWFGKMNREDQTGPALALRESAMRLGLVRQRKGRLVIARDARGLAGEPIALLEQIARRLPNSYGHELLDTSCLLLMISLSGGGTREFDVYAEMVSETLGMLGFENEYGESPDPPGLILAMRELRHDLERLSVFRAPVTLGRRGIEEDSRPTESGRAFARLSLRSA